MHLPHLISDLALILLVASVITLLFKKIKQPLVLGYIITGLLTGPYLSVILENLLLKINISISIPTVTDMENIEIWSEIGVIFLMFALGLEFSFHKLANVGKTAIILAITEVFGMLGIGYGTGIVLGWNTADSLILGAIISMSSTTIIIKAFEELNLKGKKFSELVFGGLIVEDIIGIFVMVFLSTFAVSQGAGAAEIGWTIVQLLFYLVLLLLLGIYLIPTLLKKVQRLMNDETILVVSLGLCLGMVLLFVKIGFSSALGAFIAGSILAGTIHSIRIEHLTKPIKDFFGAIFFISVGMMVNPAIIVQFAVPILLISMVVICGKLIFSSLGVLFSGNSLHTAVYCGASLAQIGEFAFIIALLAINLDLASEFLYPVVVSVSVITTFTTPFCIKSAEKMYRLVKKILPYKILDKLDNYTSDTQIENEKDKLWKDFIKKYFLGLLIYTVIIFGIIQLNAFVIAPFFYGLFDDIWAKILCTIIPLTLMAPFIINFLRQYNKKYTLLIVLNRANRLPVLVFMIIRLVIAVFFVMYTINQFMGIPMLWLILPALVIIVILSRSDTIFGRYLQIETRFLTNFNEKQLSELDNEDGSSMGNRISSDLWVGQYRFEQSLDQNIVSKKMTDKKLAKLKHHRERRWVKFRFFKKDKESMFFELIVTMMNKFYNISIIKIISEGEHINIPTNNSEKTQRLYVGDTLFLLGTKQRLDSFKNTDNFSTFIKEITPPILLQDFIEKQEQNEQSLLYFAITINKNSGLVGKSIKDTFIRKKWNCIVIGLQRGIYPIVRPNVQTRMNKDDKIWVLAGQKMFQKLVQAGLIESVESE